MDADTHTQKGSVVFIDDDKFLADMYGMKFSGAGYAVQTFLSANDALEVLRAAPEVDAVVFDLVMPGCDGFTFLETMRTQHLVEKAVKIALTNQSDDAEKKKAEDLGVDRYVVKASMIPSEVVTLVGEEIAKKKTK